MNKITEFLRENLFIFIISFTYLAILLPYLKIIPIWDAWETIDGWILTPVRQPFNPFAFDNAGHPSFVFFLILAISQYIDYGNITLLYLTNIVLGILAIFAFWGILKIIFWDRIYEAELKLTTLLFAIFPISLTNTLHINTDFGVYIFYILFLYFLLKEKKVWVTLSSLGLIFSKETGFLLFLYTGFCLILFDLIKSKFSIKVVTDRLIFAIPVILFILRLVLKKWIFREAAFWVGPEYKLGSFLYNTSFSTATVSKIPLAYFLDIFVINFNWLLSLTIIIGAFYLLITIKKKKVIDQRVNRKWVGFIAILFIGSVIITTFYKTFSNLRYFLPVYPLLIILFYFCLITLIKKDLLRRITLIFIILIFLLTNYRTFDPVSKSIYKTFKFGNNELLRMTSITGECCGYGRDQLVYNLEFLQFQILLDKILADLKPSRENIIAYHPLEGDYIMKRIDKNNYRRTFLKENLIESQLAGNYGFMRNTHKPSEITFTFADFKVKPEKLYYIEFPNLDNSDALEMFTSFYTTEKIIIYENDGYKLRVHYLKLKI